MGERSVLLIDHGDLPSLASLALQGESTRLILWHPQQVNDGHSSDRRKVVESHRELFNVQQTIIATLPERFDTLNQSRDLPNGLRISRVLHEALIDAVRLGCSRIVAPVHVGPDPDAICREVDRADAVAALAEMDSDDSGNHETSAPVIELPVVDFSDEQLVDVIEDAGVPREAFFPGEPGGDEYERWQRAFEALGIAWPWAVAANVP